MAKIRIYELARDLNMTNKDLLDKLKEMDIEAKSHMSSLDDDDVSRIRADLFGDKETSDIEEKRIKSTIIRRRKKRVEDPAPPETQAKETIEEKVEDKKTAKKKTKAEPDVKASKKKKASKEAAEPETKKKTVKPETEKPDKPAKTPPKKKTKKEAAAKIIKLPDPEDLKKASLKKTKPKKEKKSRTGKAGEKTVTPIHERPAQEKEDRKKKRKKRSAAEPDLDNKFFKKKISFRKKEVVEGKALYEDAHGRIRKTRKGKKIKIVGGEKTQITTPKAIKRRIRIDDTINLSELAKRMGIKANEMIQKLMTMGVMATVNQTIDYDTAVLVAAEFDFELEKASFEEETILSDKEDDPKTLIARPPVVTIMGHVDHGKTSLLDVIRKSKITEIEAGGITQHIGAYHVTTDNGQVVFLDTPGHEAFTAMRSRGAKVTDIVVLVVAADDGVMPQTIEAINHAKAAEVPIIVAVNKIDKEDADPEKVKRELSEHEIVSEDWGGDTIFANVSAKQKTGIDNLLDMILLQAEVLELKANPNKLARGHVVEAKLDSGRGPVATVLIQEGTLESGNPVICGIHFGKIRAMLNDKGKEMNKALPSTPVEIIGLTGVPMAGDELIALDDEKNAKQVSEHRIQRHRSKELAKSSKLSLEGLFEKMQQGEVKDLNLIIKTDVHGSIEALKESLTKIPSEEVKINIVHSAAGTITESDISLAAVSNAIVIGFNIRPPAKIYDMAEDENVDMRFYDIIYDVIKDIKDAMVGMMSSTYEERTLGRAEIREIFQIPKIGVIGGSYVIDGKIERDQKVRLVRDGVIVYDGNISSLRRFKDDAKEVASGYECGIGIEDFNDIKVNDIIECYCLDEIKPTIHE